MRPALVFASFLAGAACASAGIVPSCALSPPCPLPGPGWTTTWQLSKSTICQPGNTADFLNATAAAKFGLVSLDWSIANKVWHPTGDCSNTTGASTLVEQCKQIKAVDPTTKCLVYRNTELALQWLEPQRAAMYDPKYADLFLQYQPGNPSGTPVGTIYNENAGGPGSGCNQFFWNYSNPAAIEYVLTQSEQGPFASDSEYVDGTFLDDVTGIPAEHGHAPANIGLTADQVTILQNATNQFAQIAIEALAAKGKYIWQAFGQQDGVGGGPSAGNCAAYMDKVCSPGYQKFPWTLQWDGKNTTLAAFLIGRGPVAYVGWGWNGQPLPAWDPLFDISVGTPTGLCTQPSAGVYTRAWTEGTATLDCNTFTATLAF